MEFRTSYGWNAWTVMLAAMVENSNYMTKRENELKVTKNLLQGSCNILCFILVWKFDQGFYHGSRMHKGHLIVQAWTVLSTKNLQHFAHPFGMCVPLPRFVQSDTHINTYKAFGPLSQKKTNQTKQNQTAFSFPQNQQQQARQRVDLD